MPQITSRRTAASGAQRLLIAPSFGSFSVAVPATRNCVFSVGERTDRIELTSIVTTLPDAGYRLLKPLTILLEQKDDSVMASFDPANIHMSGDSIKEALNSLLYLIIDIFDAYGEDEQNLSREPARQLSVLRSYMTRLDAD